MLDRLNTIKERYNELGQMLAQPEITSDHEKLQHLAQEQAGLEDIVEKYNRYLDTSKSLEETQKMLDDGLDPEMVQLIKDELEKLRDSKEEMSEELKIMLLPKDVNEDKDAIVEIRAGTGGGEATLFAYDLFRMYSRYCQDKGWQVEIIDCNETVLGGFKEIIFEVKGKGNV